MKLNDTPAAGSIGTILGTYTVGKQPNGMAFDGANIWVANEGTNTVSKVRASDGAILGTYTVGYFPRSMAFDGTNIWIAGQQNTVSKLRASDGATLGVYTLSVCCSPSGVAFDGANVWVTLFARDGVTRL